MTLTDALIAARIHGPSVITIGTFDGVHLGHRHLLRQVVEHARARQATAVAITFHPRPAEVLRPGIPSQYLCSLEARTRLLREAGIEVVVPVTFSRDLAAMSALAFVSALVKHAQLAELVGGPDLALGRGREGTVEVLRDLGAQLGFAVTVVPVQEDDGEVVRSSMIQRVVAEGNVSRAAELLGRRYQIEGEVARGDGRGRTIGVPTANVAVTTSLLVPGNGVYAVYFNSEGGRWPGAANVGTRPTFSGVDRSVEVHLLDFDGDLYGRHCTVEFVERLRPERRFAGVAELVEQIHHDVAATRQILSTLV